MTPELERTKIDPAGRTFTAIAQGLAREHDPDFPPLNFDSPLAERVERPRREGSETRRRLVVDGCGWRYHGAYYDSGPGEIASTVERTVTAVHPHWTLVVHFEEATGAATQLWSTFQRWETIPDRGEEILGIAEVTHPEFGPVFSGQVIAGLISPEHDVRLLRDGHIRWRGRFHALKPSHKSALSVEEGGRFSGILDGAIHVQYEDVLECFEA